MKIWNGYGSEHSMKLVLIGKFLQSEDAQEVRKSIELLKTQADAEELHYAGRVTPENEYFSHDMLELLGDLNISTLAPSELQQLVSDHSMTLSGDTITIETDEVDVSAFVKLMLEQGAKVELFSRHHYPSEETE